MKKKFILLLMLSSLSYGFEIGAGKAIMSSGSLEIEGKSAIDISDTLGYYVEVYSNDMNIDNVPGKVGVGIKFSSYDQDVTNKSVATIATLYGIWKMELDLNSIKPYFQFRFGYPYAAEGNYVKEYNNSLGTYYNDLSGVTYLSGGLGASIYFLDASVNYDYNTYKIKTSGFSDKDVTSSNISINIGAKF